MSARTVPLPERDHYLDHYGQCVAERCDCNGHERLWTGRGCPNWQPNGARTLEELMARARRLHEERRTCA